MASDRPKSTIRVHGMNPPYHPLQVLTWIIYPLLIVQYFLLVMPLLGSLVVQIITAVVFGISAIVAVVAGGLTATINPADDACLRPGRDENVPTVLCYLCEVYVESTSKHCRTCGKCVQNFDHHCKWLNTCVGKKNYKYFLILMGGVAVMTTLSLGLSAYLIVLCFLDKDKVLTRIEDSVVLDGILSYWAVVTMLLVSSAVLLPLVLLLYQLMGFHAMLVKRGITTYDYIVSEQKRLREKRKAAADAKAAGAATTRTARLPAKSPPGGLEMNQSQTYDKTNQDDEENDDDIDLAGDDEVINGDDDIDNNQRNGSYNQVPVDSIEEGGDNRVAEESDMVIASNETVENEEAV